MIHKYEFYDNDELDRTISSLATASRRPVYAGDTRLDERVAIWNDREDELAYFGSEKYNLVQHREVIEQIREAVNITVGEIDFGMIRDYGEQVDGILVFGNREEANIDMQELLGDSYIPPDQRPDTDPTAEESRWRDTVGLGMRFSNSYNGERKVGGQTMGYRYICQNWLVWDEETIGERQTAHMREEDEDDGLVDDFFVPLITEVFDIKAEVSERFETAERTELPFGWMPDILRQSGFGGRYQKRIIERVLDYNNPSGDETTLWRLYNAATTELDRVTVDDTSLARYNQHQGHAWNIIETEPTEPEEPLTTEEIYELAE